ncbi:hypothetical protein H7J88_18675 [Mycolicibacterium flavescens]|uniref:Translation initiation factor IF-2 n=1 Tax=Mycolicibacterium flavescens TaxID=1776 RepID=A0A1E3R7Q8_MYCFV|nr:type VII secretion target [Mycolicibacterium flavescens]MCV7281662.1 hypothetical protein [Mycolicibacterium flavescens]ODQ85903.1 hypothetical protein BHQ18_28025 [Mycolicibacterium flavescens]
MTETLRVDTELVAKSGGKLQALANDIPEPPASYSPTGGDALSTAIATKVAEVVDPVLTQMPVAKEALARYAQNVINAANTYDAVDRQIAEDILKRLGLFEEAASGGTPGGGAPATGGGGSTGTAPATGAGSPVGGVQQVSASAPQAGQGIQTPVQMAQQAAQASTQMGGMLGAVPQAVQQAAQQAVQQASQLSETVGKDEESPAEQEPTIVDAPADEQAAPGPETGKRTPESLAGQKTEPNVKPERPEIAL